jgi:deoxyadenosine/deoxycytidine kinase
MQQRIASRNWHVELDINKKQLSFKDSLLHAYEKFTGKRLFAFKNYRNIIK